MRTGDLVQCRFYNTPEERFYGDYFLATVMQVLRPMKDYSKPVLVKRENGYGEIWLHRKEIKHIVKEKDTGYY